MLHGGNEETREDGFGVWEKRHKFIMKLYFMFVFRVIEL